MRRRKYIDPTPFDRRREPPQAESADHAAALAVVLADDPAGPAAHPQGRI